MDDVKAIQVQDLHKNFGDVYAVQGIRFDIVYSRNTQCVEERTVRRRYTSLLKTSFALSAV